MQRNQTGCRYIDNVDARLPRRLWQTGNKLGAIAVHPFTMPHLRKQFSDVAFHGQATSQEIKERNDMLKSRSTPNLKQLYKMDMESKISPYMVAPKNMPRTVHANYQQSKDMFDALKTRVRFRTKSEMQRSPRYLTGQAVIKDLNHSRKSEYCFPTHNDPRQEYKVTFQQAYSEIVEQRNMDYLYKIFLAVDEDGSGDISLDEFVKSVRGEGARQIFGSLGIQPHESVSYFKQLAGRTGLVDAKVFVDGLATIKAKNEREQQERFG